MSEERDSAVYQPIDMVRTINNLENDGDEQRNGASTTYDVSVNELEKRVCYFSLGGDLALSAFSKYYCDEQSMQEKDRKLKSEVLQRLYFAVVMFDIVVFHCSDPLRSPLIKEILTEHKNWIQEGRIRFIANSDISSWESDYRKYIDRKYNAYQTGYYAQLEAQSLRQPHITETYIHEVIALLNNSDWYVRKDLTSSSQFTSLLREDIKHNNERIVIALESEEDSTFSHVNQFAVEKTVYQLVHAQYYSTGTGNMIQDVFDSKLVRNTLSRLRQALDKGQAVARPAIVEAIKGQISEPTELQEAIFDAITLRMDLLYCRMNAGRHLILEFHPSYSQQTLYKLDCFNHYIKKFGFKQGIEYLTMQKVNELLNSQEIDDFRRVFLASMADTHEQNNFTMKIWSISTVFNDRCKRLLPSDITTSFPETVRILS